MRELVQTDQNKCVGCNRCVRECPIELANLTYRNEDGEIKVRVNQEACIACGACISVCAHEARLYQDDTEAFFRDLAGGKPISMIIAPSAKTNFPHLGRMLSWLRGLGVRKIYDASLGADLCIWAHLKDMKARKPERLISQPCPAIVSYCETYRHDLLEVLSPVQSPISCLAVYMRRYEGVEDSLAALTPCIAKANEFDSVGNLAYNITFAKLAAYLEERAVQLPQTAGGFDHDEAGLGALFPTPGGFMENMEYFLGKSLRMDRAEGPEVYSLLDLYGQSQEGALPVIFDVLNCARGCNMGPACIHEQTFFQINATMDKSRRATLEKWEGEQRESLYREFDRRLDPKEFLREYSPRPIKIPQVGEEEIQRAFLLLDKDTEEKQRFNCGACGSDSCREMAVKVARNINIPLNCVVMARDYAESERVKNARLYRRNAEYIELIHHIGENMISAHGESHSRKVKDSLQKLCLTFNGGIVSLWKVELEEGRYRCDRRYSWPEAADSQEFTVQKSWPEQWLQTMAQGQYISAGRDKMDPDLFPPRVRKVRTVPILIKGSFWGFLAFVNEVERRFQEEEISVVIASGLLIVASILEHELTESLIVAREEALEGTRAKSDFLSRMSHEMRTPMNAIIGMTKIAGGTEDMDRLRYCLATVQASSNQLLGLINDVLDMSKIEAGKFELNHAPFAMEEAVSNVCRIIADKVEEKELALLVKLDSSANRIYLGDELHFFQVVSNLLSNAVKFTPEGGRVLLSIWETGSRDGKSRVRVSVEDTGIGFSKEQAGRLFDPFEQADAGITKRFGGTGLGLAISQSIVEEMNGWIKVASTPGQGSVFSFEVELEREGWPEGIACPYGARLLLVDQDPVARELFQETMGDYCRHVEAAASGGQAEEMVERAAGSRAPFTLILTALALPDMSGLELARRLSCQERPPAVVALAGFTEWTRVEHEARRAGVCRVLTKPLLPSAVLGEVSWAAEGSCPLPIRDEEERDLSGLRLLLVEDIEINRIVVTSLLEETGVKIDEAENGRIAVEMVSEHPDRYDMVIMDIQMPEMDGHQATRAIRKLDAPRAQTIPIVAMTANAFQDDIDACLESGMNDHLTKPVDEVALIETIKEYTGAERRCGRR